LLSVFLYHQILDWHFIDHHFLGNSRGRRRIRAEARVRVSLGWGLDKCQGLELAFV